MPRDSHTRCRGQVLHDSQCRFVGDVIATRRNDRHLVTSSGEPVRNRDTWTVTTIGQDQSLTVTHQRGHGTVTLPAGYVAEHVQLGYAATEHGHQGDTVTTSIALATPATTRRGLYVAATRGRGHNHICVVTDSTDMAEARDILDSVLALDRADIPVRHPTTHPRSDHPTSASTFQCGGPPRRPPAAATPDATRDPGARTRDRPRHRLSFDIRSVVRSTSRAQRVTCGDAAVMTRRRSPPVGD